MREQVSNFFFNLPPEGIAIHGTNLARARAIQQSGLNSACLPGDNPRINKGQYYIVQPPAINLEYRETTFREIEKRISQAKFYANLAAHHTQYHLPSNPAESTIEAFVILQPLRPFDLNSLQINLAPFPYTAREIKPVPKENIRGIIGFGNNIQVRELLKNVTEVINGRQEIMLLKPK